RRLPLRSARARGRRRPVWHRRGGSSAGEHRLAVGAAPAACRPADPTEVFWSPRRGRPRPAVGRQLALIALASPGSRPIVVGGGEGVTAASVRFAPLGVILAPSSFFGMVVAPPAYPLIEYRTAKSLHIGSVKV